MGQTVYTRTYLHTIASFKLVFAFSCIYYNKCFALWWKDTHREWESDQKKRKEKKSQALAMSAFKGNIHIKRKENCDTCKLHCDNESRFKRIIYSAIEITAAFHLFLQTKINNKCSALVIQMKGKKITNWRKKNIIATWNLLIHFSLWQLALQ